MALDFKLPDIGEGIAEGEIVKWLVNVGDVVKEHQSIVEVMTDKATVEVPAPAAGKITAIKAKEGEIVPVGSVIFVLDTSASAPGARDASATAPKAAASSARSAASTPPASSAASPTSAGNAARSTASSPSSAPSPVRAGGADQAASRPAAAEASRSAPAAGSTQSTIEFKLPDIGEGIAEGEIVKWLVKVGDAVKEHQSVVEVMTDKATVEVPAPAAGTITAIQAKEGEVVPVGTVIFKLATRVAAGAAQPSVTAQPATHAPAQVREPALIGAASSAHARVATSSGNDVANTGTRDKVLAVPSARRVAREMGVDLARVAGSGRNGVVRRADVENFVKEAPSTATPARETAPAAAAARTPAAPISIPSGTREKRTPFRGVRRKIAEAMVRSKFTAPHFTVVEEVDVTDLVSLREKAKAIGAESGVKVTFMPFIMKATALALAKYPMLNGHLDEAAQELVHYEYVNLGIAMDTEQGLIVPVVKEVQGKGILQLAQELHELAERTRAGKVKPDDLKGSTFSITNAGNIGGTFATPIINFPDIAILGVHRLMKKPGVVETPSGDKIEVRQYMNFSVSVDHRLADGADGARFLVYVKRLLENPGLLAL